MTNQSNQGLRFMTIETRTVHKKFNQLSYSLILCLMPLTTTHAEGALGFLKSLGSGVLQSLKDSVPMQSNSQTFEYLGTTWTRCVYGQEIVNMECKGNTKQMNWYSVIKTANQTTLYGYSDWRVPTRQEIETVKRYFNNNSLQLPDGDRIWTTSSDRTDPLSAWSANVQSSRVYDEYTEKERKETTVDWLVLGKESENDFLLVRGGDTSPTEYLSALQMVNEKLQHDEEAKQRQEAEDKRRKIESDAIYAKQKQQEVLEYEKAKQQSLDAKERSERERAEMLKFCGNRTLSSGQSMKYVLHGCYGPYTALSDNGVFKNYYLTNRQIYIQAADGVITSWSR